MFHQPVRTKIVSLLINSRECDYTTIKKTCDLSDGLMTTHMKELVGAGYVEAKKEFVDNKPRTTYSLTSEGKKKFKAYIENLKELIGGNI